MRLVEIARHPTDAERAVLVRFVEHVTAVTGERPLSDHLWLDLTGGDGDGFVAVRVADPTGTIALAQVSEAHGSSTLEAFADPATPDRSRVLEDAVETAIDTFVTAGGGRLSWWVDDPTDRDRELASRFGLVPARRLHEMQRSLPLDEHATVTTRSFEPGRDEDDWLRVNNRAFADHGEQGGWTRDLLALRMAEPWFDPEGFRLHERDGRLAAFCWTKIHPEHDPVLGEIYVIAVDPDHRGQGLGRELTLAGLDAIAARGVTLAGLYVDADNTAAVALYDRLGFTIRHTRQAFAGTVVP